jgi:crossover junction endodeoxyribonuclease RuvC
VAKPLPVAIHFGRLPTRVNAERYCVLGIDPAAAGATGFGIVEREGSRCRMVRLGALRPAVPLATLVNSHLCHIHSLIAGLIQEFQPRAVAVESVFTALNVKAAFRLAEVRGVVLLAAAQAGVPSFSYSPREVKATVAGYGHAGKEQVQQMVRALLSMTETPEPADAADALALALCHIQIAESKARLGASLHTEATARRRNRTSTSRILSVR